MIVQTGALPHEVPAGTRVDRDDFDREGYAVGRRLFPPELLREVRAPLADALLADGYVERVEGDDDRLRWIGDGATFDRSGYRSAVLERCDELLLRSGVAAEAVEAAWGRRAAIWEGATLFLMLPGDPERVHRDGWHKMGVGEPGEHFNLWAPLTRLGDEDGVLAIAEGSHQIPDQAARVPMAHPIHKDVVASSGACPPADLLESLWRMTGLEVGDALVFRPDIVHSATSNTGPYLRVALGLHGQDARVPLPYKAGLSLDSGRLLTEVEWLTLSLLSLQPSSPWLARCAFYSRGIIGRLWREPPDSLVERAFTTLEARGLVESYEQDDDGGEDIHQYFQPTSQGRAEVAEWLTKPGSNGQEHLLSIRLVFADWLGLDTTRLLVGRPLES